MSAPAVVSCGAEHGPHETETEAMTKFQKRPEEPVFVDAVHWTGSAETCDFASVGVEYGPDGQVSHREDGGLMIRDAHKVVYVRPGWWLVRDEYDRLRTMSDESFRHNYLTARGRAEDRGGRSSDLTPPRDRR